MRTYTAITIIVLGALMAHTEYARSELPQSPAEQKPQGGPGVQEAKKDAVQQKVLEFNLEGYTDKGVKQWEIKGESAESAAKDKIKLNNIVAKTFGDEAEATLTADRGIYDTAKNSVMLEENVKVDITNAATFTQEYVDIPLAAPADGSGGEKSDPAGGARAAAPQEGQGKKSQTTITCDGELEFSYAENEAHFSKNVRVMSDEGEIDADKITIYLDVKSKKLKEVVADGNVKITRGENVVFSDRATYIEDEKKVILTGSPKLVFYQEGGLEAQFMGKTSK